METREYVKSEIDVLPEEVFERVKDFVLFEKYRWDLNKNGYDWLSTIPIMTDSIKSNKSLTAKSASQIDDFFSTYGAWEDDRDTDAIIADIQNSRVNKESITL
jgi:hypothetical protein